MINSKSFIKDPGNEESHPLHECYKWARDHCIQSAAPEREELSNSQSDSDGEKEERLHENDEDDEQITPMIVFQKQYGDAMPDTPTFREFVASTISSFISYYMNAKPTDRHCDEIVGLGPCKAYCDLELEFDDGKARRLGYADMADLLRKHGCADRAAMRAELEVSSAKWIEHVRADLEAKHGTPVKCVLTKAHKESKWSKHVVFVGSLWRNTAHLGAYMRRKVRELSGADPLVRLYVDTVVYSRFRAMRMYRSSKLKEPHRSLLLADGSEKQTDAVDAQVLLDSLITVIPLPPPPPPPAAADGEEAPTSEPMYTTTTFLDRYPEMIRAFGMQPLESADVLTSRLLSSIGAGPVGSSEEFSVLADTGTNDPCSPASAEFRRTFRKHFGHLKPYAFKWVERRALLVIECKTHQCVILGGEHENNHIFIELDVLQRVWRYACHSDRCVSRPTPWRDLYPDLDALCAEFAPRWRYATACTALAQMLAQR